jgi:hypothetical protein
MLDRRLAIAIGAIALILNAPAGHAGEKLSHIRFAHGISRAHRAILKADWQELAKLRITQARNRDLKALLDIKSLSPAQLVRWLDDRIQVIVPPDFDPNQHLVQLKESYSYDLPDLHAVDEAPAATAQSAKSNAPGSSKADWDLASLSAGYYQYGKAIGSLLGMRIRGAGTIRFTSPRAGVIIIGPGLFDPPANIRKRGATSKAPRVYRLSAFFHEARHSDGNGLSAGFFHAVCPPGHAMAGYEACDRNLNGPYTVGASMMKAMAEEGCEDCTVADREALRLNYVAFFGRVLPTELDGKTPTRAWIDAPEGLRK